MKLVNSYMSKEEIKQTDLAKIIGKANQKILIEIAESVKFIS